MAFDPFADDTENDSGTEEPDFESKPAPKTTAKRPAARKTATKKENNVAEANETRQSKLSITLKGGSGFDAPWVVIYPDTLQEAQELLDEDNRELLKDVLEKTQAAAQYFVSKGTSSAPQGRSGGQGGGNARQAAQEAPNGETRFCEHGKMKFKSGVSAKSGKPYKMFVCDGGVPREQECKPQFLN